MTQDFRFKQAIVIRVDLGMGRGKIAVQCSHAAVSAGEEARLHFPDWWRSWINEGQCKVALKAGDLAIVSDLERNAKAQGLPASVIRDRGLTQVDPDTVTCIGIGPAPSELLDVLTGNLSLL